MEHKSHKLTCMLPIKNGVSRLSSVYSSCDGVMDTCISNVLHSQIVSYCRPEVATFTDTQDHQENLNMYTICIYILLMILSSYLATYLSVYNMKFSVCAKLLYYYVYIFVTGFEKTRLPHTSDFTTLANHNSL